MMDTLNPHIGFVLLGGGLEGEKTYCDPRPNGLG